MKNTKIFLLVLLNMACVKPAFAQDKKLTSKETIDTNKVEKFVEAEAEFPGGDEGYVSYLVNTIKYPSKAIRKNIQGTVQVEFIVCENGDVCNARVVKGEYALLNAEALRAITNSPKWKPGTQNGKVVNSYRTVPITFVLGK